jgi:hypothetical protein
MRLLATSLFALVAPLVPAQAIIAQPSGLGSPARLIDFGTALLPDGTPVSTQFAGLTISHASYFTTTTLNNVAGGHLADDPAAAPPATLSIRFAQPVGSVSFVYHQIGTQAPSTIRARLQGLTVDSFNIVWNETQPNNFFGFAKTALDEVQIDFVGNFRLDALAFDPVGGAACFPYNGNNVNPPSFGCVTLPVLGATWQSSIFNTPDTLFTALVYAPAGLGQPMPLSGGELLLSTAQPLVAFTGTTNYSFAVPAASSWVGTRLVFQGVRFDRVQGSPTLVPLNAMMVMLGL